MTLDRNQTKRLQGIAILFMLGLHLFNRVDIADYYDVRFYTRGGVPFLTYISYLFDGCVPIYLFCSGYGLYISEEHGSNVQKRGHRIMKLLIRFWIIMILTCYMGFAMGMRDRFPGGFMNFILNAFLIKSSYVGAFWFVQTYTILALVSGLVYKMVRRYHYLLLTLFSFILYFIAFGIEYIVMGHIETEALLLLTNALMLLCRSQFSFVIGMIFAKERLIDCCVGLTKIRNSRWIPWVGLAILIVVRANLRHMIFAPFSGIMLIILFGTYDWGKIGKSFWLFFGKHSTNMWLVHMQFYMIFTPQLVFGSRNIFVIMLTLIGLSLMTSYLVDLLYKLVTGIYEKYLKFI